ncbi:MAG: diacylglycerol kinase [Elusimicrobia bacterium GWA2_61_42]|nr:MAG: diacylglycerol kinase [Elusimicrobia bacterium GWA2_61_42]OGR79199.1 MAG: diacylglycerol kinase [Elusimicrobia bacterium GWC2_61_25]
MKKRMLSFKYAGRGVWWACSEPNFRIHLAAASAAVFLGFWLGLSAMEWCAVLLCFSAVMSAEALNSAVEKLTDLVSPGHHVLAGKAKDLAAGAVLISAVMAAVVGCIIFLPKLAARL